MDNGWRGITGTPDFERGAQIAVYKRTDRGYAIYWVFPKSLAKGKRTQRNALSIGGLPK